MSSEKDKPFSLEDLQAIFPKQKGPQVVNWEDTAGHDRFDDVFQIKETNEVLYYEEEANLFTFYCENKVAIRVQWLNEQLIRIRYAAEGTFEWDNGYAIDPQFKAEEVAVYIAEQAEAYVLNSKQYQVVIAKSNAGLSITDAHGKELCAEYTWEQRSTILKGITHVKLSRQAQADEIFYGLGDKSGALNLRGNRFENWNTDAFGYGYNSDPLYRSIPFYYSLSNGIAHGIFLDNTHRTRFDFAANAENQIEMQADAGELNFYFIGGPDLMQVAQRYAQLTGVSDLPPMWGLGFHQCRWSYYPEKRVREVCAEFRKRKIPCDAIYLDIDYMDGYRCFTVNEDHFPDLGKMVGELRADGFHTIVMIDPGIRTDENYHVFAEGKEKKYFCMRKDGTMMRGPVWPQDCAFPDYTNGEVREWWGQLYEKLYNEQQVSGFWNDMNEPAVFKVNSKTFPEDVRHDYEGHGAEHARIHNIYGQQMVRATHDGLLKLQPNKRPIVITRATYAGGQRYSSAWTGDNVASWEHLAMANRQCQRMSISGFSYIGTDIGGFVDQPTGELLVRWLQLAVFHPLYRIHSMGNNDDGAAEADAEKIAEAERINRMDQEPWVFGSEYEKQARAAIELRYKLLPYVYSSFWQHTQYGVPVLRQLSFEDQADSKALACEDEFMFGDHLLAVTIHEPEQSEKNIYLPKGKWVDYWSKKMYEGAQHHDIEISADHIPIFIKGGSIIAHHPVRQSTSEAVGQLELQIFADQGQFEQEIYEDAGEGYEFQKGEFLLRQILTSISNESMELTVKRMGTYTPAYKKIVLSIYNLPFAPTQCTVDKVDKSHAIQYSSGVCRIELNTLGFNNIELQ